MKKIVETNPEFASEIVLSIPYAYWLHKNDMLEKMVICKGMSPFYYFCDNIEEQFEFRSLDNAQALKDIPNKWLHNSEAGGKRNGVIDYNNWSPPPYKEYYKNDLFEHLKPYVVVNNIFNIESDVNGTGPRRFFGIEMLYHIFDTLTSLGYNIIYKRPDNTEFILDQNEVFTNQNNVTLTANVEGFGQMTDYELCKQFDNVTNITEFNNLFPDYSTLNLNVFAEADGFVSVNGGGYQLFGYFDKPLIIYTSKGKELRPNYLEYEDSYIKMLGNANVYPIIDKFEDWEINGGQNITDTLRVIKKVFK
jgi:hypothetical protein